MQKLGLIQLLVAIKVSANKYQANKYQVALMKYLTRLKAQTAATNACTLLEGVIMAVALDRGPVALLNMVPRLIEIQ